MKIRIVLPALQLFIAVVLLSWGHTIPDPIRYDTPFVPTPTLICEGITAPALFVRPVIDVLPAYFLGPFQLRIAGFMVEEILFLVAVAVVWYLVAIRIANRDRTELAVSSFAKWRAVVWHLCRVAAGVVLLIEAVNSFKPYGRFNNPLGSRIQGVLFLIWAVALILNGVTDIFRGSRKVTLKSSPSF
jgi:hypothetical protein